MTDVENNKLNDGEEITYKGYRLLTLHNKYNTGEVPEMVHGRHLLVKGIGLIHKPPGRSNHRSTEEWIYNQIDPEGCMREERKAH